MKAQDIPTEKQSLITWITQLQDITVIEELKEIRLKNDTADPIIPEWQRQLVRDRIKNTKPEDYKSWEEIEQQLKLDE